MTPYYDEDGITIYHGDCREILPALTADAVITDPPYGVDLTYGDSFTDTRVDYELFVADFMDTARSAAPLVAVTPGLRNLFLYPTPNWTLCWIKANSMRRNDTGGFNMWEPIAVYGKRRIWQDVFPCPTVVKKDVGDHPCPKPLELFRWLTRILTDDGETILDPFVGSGTTLRAAKDLGREAIGIDVEEKYCEIAAQRLAQGVLSFD